MATALIVPRAVALAVRLKVPWASAVVLPDSTEVRVWDSTAELRYLVIPCRPAGTEALSEDQLAGLVTRDSMIGTAVLAAP